MVTASDVKIIDCRTRGDPDLGARALNLLKLYRFGPSVSVTLASRERQIGSEIKSIEPMYCSVLNSSSESHTIKYSNGTQEIACPHLQEEADCLCSRTESGCIYQQEPLKPS